MNPKLTQLIKYTTGSATVLGVKLLSTWIFIKFFEPRIAYLFVHFVIFFASYFYHVGITFKQAYSLASLKNFTKAVIGIKVLDYIIFSILFAYLDIQALLAVFLATLIIFTLRYFALKKLLKP